MASVKTSGTSTATVGAETTVATVTDEGQYTFEVDTAALVDGEQVELRIYTKVLSGGTERLRYHAVFKNTQGSPAKTSPAIISPHHSKFTIEQTGGTARAFPWAVYEAD